MKTLPDIPGTQVVTIDHLEVPLRVLAPNLVTLMALCLGLTAIRLAIEGKLDLAVYAVLAAAVARGVDLEAPLLVRHHLVDLPAVSLERAAELLGQDGYAVVPVGPGLVHACRTQVLTALSASQERSRMAGLAQRLGGDVAGWDALRPAAPPA